MAISLKMKALPWLGMSLPPRPRKPDQGKDQLFRTKFSSIGTFPTPYLPTLHANLQLFIILILCGLFLRLTSEFAK